MIEGLKVTIKGTELRQLCLKRAKHHLARAKVYAQQESVMVQSRIEGAASSSGSDPVRDIKDKREEHESGASEMSFIADHIVPRESYLLDLSALSKLGIAKSRW
jgi:hypothetical protein